MIEPIVLKEVKNEGFSSYDIVLQKDNVKNSNIKKDKKYYINEMNVIFIQ